jgi:CRISPR-associated exonuclease Cas4
MKKFDDSERLALSSLKQYVYCNRRFALMFIDNEWGSNHKIVEGDIFHLKVDDPTFNEKRGEVHISRSVPIFSDRLHLYGVADMLEFWKDPNGISLPDKKGFWRINPIEYKNGKPESSQADNIQLCAQALCLEEMFQTVIHSGQIYYGKIKRRITVEFTDELRGAVDEQLSRIKLLMDEMKIPSKPDNQNCKLCSLSDICLPQIFDWNRGFRISLNNLIKEDD